MKFKQSPQELIQIISDLYESYRPNRELANSEANGILLRNWVVDHYTENGVTDFNYNAARKAVQALESQLHWDKKPVKQIEKPQKASDLNEQLAVAMRDARNEQAAAQSEADLEAIGAAQFIIKSFSDYPHSKTIKGKAALAAEYDKQIDLVKSGKQTPQGLLATVKAAKGKL